MRVATTPARRPVAGRWLLAGCAALAGCAPLVASAHAAGKAPPTPGTIWTNWSADPGVILSVLLGSWLYGAGMLRLWTRAPRGRKVFMRRGLAFAGGIAAIIVALVSPLDGMSEALFSAHMTQHLLLLLVAAPLLVLGEPLAPLFWSLPKAWRRRVASAARSAGSINLAWRVANRPLVAWSIATVALWAWHLPPLYDAAVQHAAVHALEHSCFLGTALLFWQALLRGHGARAMHGGAGVLYVFAAGMQSGILGALMTFAGSPWYSVHASTTGPWGLTPLEDQQLAGLIMWIPASVIYLAAAATLFVNWLRQMEIEGDRHASGAPRRRAATGGGAR